MPAGQTTMTVTRGGRTGTCVAVVKWNATTGALDTDPVISLLNSVSGTPEITVTDSGGVETVFSGPTVTAAALSAIGITNASEISIGLYVAA